MDKIKINNQVVAMRKFVKQGKTRIINKFVKEVQLLRNRKGGEEKITKCQRKADRLLEEISILRKIRPDTLSRMALSKSKDWKSILSQKGVSLEDRCHALLASYEPIQKEVEKFYSENSYLTLKIPSLIQEWEEKQSSLVPLRNKNSFKDKGKSFKMTRSAPSSPEKKVEVMKQGKQSLESWKQPIKDEDRGTLTVRDSEDGMVDSSEDEGYLNSNSTKAVAMVNLNAKKDVIKQMKHGKQPIKEDDRETLKVRDSEDVIVDSSKDESYLDSNSTKAVALLNLNELMDMDEIPIVSSKPEEKLESEIKKRKKDSFFLKDGEDVSGSDQSNEDSDDDETGTFTQKNTRNNSFNHKSSFAYHGRNKMEKDSSHFRNKGFSVDMPRVRKFEKSDQKFRKEFNSKEKFNKFTKNSNRQYSDQQDFQKNKWNRGDNGNRKGSKPFGNFQEKKQTFNRNKPENQPRSSFAKSDKKDEPPLHPSWEAKRKLKQATNTKFQGKRMVFDD